MKRLLSLLPILFLLTTCGDDTAAPATVKDQAELREAILQAIPGTEIVLANGVWRDTEIKFYGLGTEASPITLRAETPGEVILEGQSFLHLGGEYLIVEGLHFRNGYSPDKGIIRYQIGKDSVANHSRVTACVIDGFTRPSRRENDRWIEFYGKHNQLDHCYIAGKANDGVTLMVYHNGNQHTENYHQIVYNYFGPRPRKGGPRAETIRTGGSETSMTAGRVNVSNNYFEACNGEVEIISDKTNYNSFTHNVFYKCEGSLVLRHSNYATVDGNIFIGGDDSDFYGGIRVVNTGHWITNNYFYKIRGEQFRSPLAIMNGIPKSSLNRYKQVTDAVVAYNTWVDCQSPWQIGVGQNKASADVLPASEIRSAPPIRTTIANNLIYNTRADSSPVVNHDKLSGILFRNNVIDNQGSEVSLQGSLRNVHLNMTRVNDWLLVPEENQNEVLSHPYVGYGFTDIHEDLFGSSRDEGSQIGAISDPAAAAAYTIDRGQYGPTWYTPTPPAATPTVHTLSSGQGDQLSETIERAAAGDIIELSEGVYPVSTSLTITKAVTLRGREQDDVQLAFTGSEAAAAFTLAPGGSISLENLSVNGQSDRPAFAPLEEMSSPYRLSVTNCVLEDFTYLLEATEGSFADSITLRGSTFRNCENGIVLAADERGDYNAEMVTITDCVFDNVRQNVVHFYRGGYDESTIGGYLRLIDNTFTNCGRAETSGVLLKTRGIINVLLQGNTFRDNPVTFVAVLWGEKNNRHRDNTFLRSGTIKVEAQQALELLY